MNIVQNTLLTPPYNVFLNKLSTYDLLLISYNVFELTKISCFSSLESSTVALNAFYTIQSNRIDSKSRNALEVISNTQKWVYWEMGVKRDNWEHVCERTDTDLFSLKKPQQWRCTSSLPQHYNTKLCANPTNELNQLVSYNRVCL